LPELADEAKTKTKEKRKEEAAVMQTAASKLAVKHRKSLLSSNLPFEIRSEFAKIFGEKLGQSPSIPINPEV
jgi:hypothetical protein